ncbi:hypothetical protein P7D98_23030 [Enterococcus avium]|uniref:ImmA/IrrE family metallo-endopeptidase n=1 Tax=Enterococcus avium TaxID=33945 RepID=A0ABD5FEX4_ENTAV|nr:hypothetical protein [Enterococcus avium]MDT2438325.1 hypothetical protein [Enterococcus avium]MDT2460936.1 hypothetical protein [Enterococcus avium]MDT2468513.1 hypothetical protein [Enterococcus avium]MDT2485960.1 hypothetical protein [Enterococcus avium]MDT2507930.1 hypothetical protein [Enterococcus avium]
MKIPLEIKVGGINYTIEMVEVIDVGGERNFQGMCHFDLAKIEILNSLSDQRIEQTFIHELTHAIFYEAGYDEQDEDMINRVGIVLHQVMKELII